MQSSRNNTFLLTEMHHAAHAASLCLLPARNNFIIQFCQQKWVVETTHLSWQKCIICADGAQSTQNWAGLATQQYTRRNNKQFNNSWYLQNRPLYCRSLYTPSLFFLYTHILWVSLTLIFYGCLQQSVLQVSLHSYLYVQTPLLQTPLLQTPVLQTPLRVRRAHKYQIISLQRGWSSQQTKGNDGYKTWGRKGTTSWSRLWYGLALVSKIN